MIAAEDTEHKIRLINKSGHGTVTLRELRTAGVTAARGAKNAATTAWHPGGGWSLASAAARPNPLAGEMALCVAGYSTSPGATNAMRNGWKLVQPS